jgi:hypothetical protein
VGDGELICLAGSLVETRGSGGKVCNIDRTPNRLFRCGVVDLACKLNGRVPQTAE